jgi:cell shape-determining protein MreC
MDAGSNNSIFKVTTACLLGAMLLAILPDSLTAQLRDAVRAILQPGQSALLAMREHADKQWVAFQSDEFAARNQEFQDLAARARASEFQARQSALAIRELQRQLAEARRYAASQFPTQPTEPLLSVRAVEARILGKEILAGLKSRQLLDLGQANGLREDQWVVDTERPILDLGSDQSLRTGLPVFAGRCIVGRVAQSGRWTSSLQLITATDFRAKAILADARGLLPESSPQGLLEGTGSGCRLTQVGANENVQVGDTVYSVPGFPVDAPMLFGVVASCTRQPGALHWDVEVEPHVDVGQIRTVQILTPTINPQRLAERD